MTPLAACRHEVSAFLEEPLASPARVEQLFTETKLPSEAFAAFYLECRLSPPGAELDFLAGASLERARELGASSQVLEKGPVSSYVAEWLDERSELCAPFVWLERDELPGAGHRPTGNVHVCVDSAYRMRLASGPGGAAFDPRAALDIAREMQARSLLAEHHVETIQHFLDGMPSGGRLVHVSAMLARAPAELKLYLALPTASLGQYLSQKGFDEQWRALEPWATEEVNGATVFLDLTFRGKVGRRASLVFSQQQLPDVSDEPSRPALRARLVREGLCTLAQDAALDAWMRPPIAPVSSLDSRYRVRRWLDLKLTAGEAMTTKAYLGFAAVESLF